jgi:RNAse (barnase) inhibitor barstar
MVAGRPFKDELADYRKALIEQRPDNAQRGLALQVIDRWMEHGSVQSLWDTLMRELRSEDRPLPVQFIDLMLQRRILAERVEEVDQEAADLEKKVQSRAKRHLKDKAYAKASIELGLLTDFIDQRKRVLGRERGGHRKIFIVGWSQKFDELCGQPLDEVVRVLTEIAFDTEETIGGIRGARRPSSRGDRDTQTQK